MFDPNSRSTLEQLRKRVGKEQNPEELKSIALQMLRLLKKADSPYLPAGILLIRRLRAKLNLSQTDLGVKLNCSAMAISRWERGRQEVPTRCLLQLGKLAGPPDGWSFWKMAGITIQDVRAMIAG